MSAAPRDGGPLPEKTPGSGLRISLPLAALDLIGAGVVAAGLARIVGNVDLLPESWRFDGDGIVCLLLGVGLMVPFNVHLLRQILERGARERAQRRERKP